MLEVVRVDDGVADETDEDWRDYEELVDAVAGDGVEKSGDCELRERYYGGVNEEGDVEDVDEAGYCGGWSAMI